MCTTAATSSGARLFPVWKKFSGAQRALARAASHFAEGAELLNELAAIDRAAVLTSAGRVGLSALERTATGAHVICCATGWNAGFRAPDTRWIDEARHQLSTASALSETCLKTGRRTPRLSRRVVHRPPSSLPLIPIIYWNGEDELPWAGGRVRFVALNGGGIQRALLEAGAVYIRPRQGGERLQTHPARPRRSLRNLLKEASIPAWERNYLPVELRTPGLGRGIGASM